MSAQGGEAPVALSFFDPERGISGTIRSALTLVFEGRQARAERAEAELEPTPDGWRARVGDELELELTRASEEMELGGVAIAVCSVEGRIGATRVSGLGTIALTRRTPEWRELESLRAISAVFARDMAVLAIARRPRSAAGHGEELVSAALLEPGGVRSPEDARISTVYDSGGRQHTSGIELWLPGEEFPRRLFGTVQGGTSLELDGLLVHAGAFTWRMEGNVGSGLYELTLRRGGDGGGDDDDDRPAAA